jgi:hypothetical protein
MEDKLNKKNLKKYITDNNFKVTHETLDHVISSLKNRNSKLFKELTNVSKIKVGGKITLPSEYFGKDSGNYSSMLLQSPTEVSTPNVLTQHTRPSFISNTFPLQGGCDGTCGIGMSGGGNNKFNGGCNCLGNHHRKNCTQKGGCSVCLNFFRHTDIKNISKLLNISISKKDYSSLSSHLNIQLKNILNKTFTYVKNKHKLIGKSHFNKALK